MPAGWRSHRSRRTRADVSHRRNWKGQQGKPNPQRHLFVGDQRQYVSWRQENNDRIQLVADKRSYSPGETASILIPSPFQGQVTALVTVERGGFSRSK